MTTEGLLALFQRIADDISENRAPPSAPLDTGSIANSLEKLHANLPAIIATVRSHQGVVTGLADLLAALSKAGVPHAAEIETAILAFPAALDTAEKWLPWILPFLGGGGMFAPAPRGGPPITEGQPWLGPQKVENPSGAIGGAQPWPDQ